MKGRGGFCIARYGGGGGNYIDMSKVDRIMLKYRPIAPKPAVASGSKTESVDFYVKNARPKRKYVRDLKRKRIGTGRRKVTPEESSSGGASSSGGETAVTLPFLAEIPERKESPARVGKKPPICLSFDRREIVSREGHVAFPVAKTVRVVESCVRVECVMETWVDRNGLGKTDGEKVMNLERDTCPGFVSDGYNVVKWTNEAYREMVGEVNGEMMVWLVMKDLVLLPLMSEAFTCRVRVSCRKDGGSLGAMTVLPCDVWRMENGGFAWRLDIKAALSLGSVKM